MKVNAGKSKVMVFGGEDGAGCDVSLSGVQLEQVRNFRYLGCVFKNIMG